MRITPLLILAFTVLAVACTAPIEQPQAPATAPTPVEETSVVEVRVEAYNFGFEPNTITVPAGSRVRFIATARDGNHGISIPAFNVNTGEFSAGETKTVEFVADKAGEYPFSCNVFCGSGHKSMKGTLIVE